MNIFLHLANSAHSNYKTWTIVYKIQIAKLGMTKIVVVKSPSDHSLHQRKFVQNKTVGLKKLNHFLINLQCENTAVY